MSSRALLIALALLAGCSAPAASPDVALLARLRSLEEQVDAVATITTRLVVLDRIDTTCAVAGCEPSTCSIGSSQVVGRRVVTLKITKAQDRVLRRAKEKNPQTRREVLNVLNELGVTTNDAYTPPEGGGGGWVDLATSDLDMDGFDILDPATINVATGNFTIDANDETAVITLDAGGTTFVLDNSAQTVAFGGDTSINGSLTNRAAVVAITAGVGAPTTLTQAQSGSLVTCTGTTVLAACVLPDGATVGTFYDFLIDDVTDGMQVAPDSGATIDFGVWSVSSLAHSSRQGSSFRCTLTATNTWVATSITGTWRDDSTTSGGWAFTPTPWTAVTISHAWDADADVSESILAMQDGAVVTYQLQMDFAGAPPTSTLTISALTTPGGQTLVVDEANLLGYASGTVAPLLSRGYYEDNSSNDRPSLIVQYVEASNLFYVTSDSGTAGVDVTQTVPILWAADDSMALVWQVSALQ